MKSLKIKSSGRIVVARLAEGDDIIESVKELVMEHKIKGGLIKGIGALSKASIRFFNSEKNEYDTHEFEEFFEVTSLLGNIAWKDKEPFIHIHINLGRKNGDVIGGHCSSPSLVYPTLEIYIIETDTTIKRVEDEKWKLPLLDL